DPRRTTIGDQPVVALAPGAATDAVPGFQNQHALPRLGEEAGGGQPGDARTDDDSVEGVHLVRVPAGDPWPRTMRREASPPRGPTACRRAGRGTPAGPGPSCTG